MRKLREEARELKEKLEREKLRLEKEREELKQKYSMLALEELEKNKKLVEELISTIREKNSLEEARDLRKTIEEKEKQLKEEVQKSEKRRQKLKPTDQFKAGDQVILKQSNLPATILSIEGAKATVQAGIMTVTVPLVDLEMMPQKDSGPKMHISRYRSQKESIKTEINVIGKTVEEAVDEIDQYLDSAFLAGLGSVRIVHGKGTGALRKGIQEYLKAHPHVKGFRDGAQGEGGIGATVVELN